MIESDIFEPFERLIKIEICGERREVPENNTLLRCFQYLSIDAVSFGDFCWNGDCANCQVWLEDTAKDKPVLACRTQARDEMKIVRMSGEIEIVMSDE